MDVPRLERGGPVDLVTAGIATVGFYQNVSEFKPFGRLLWKSIAWLDVNFPGACRLLRELRDAGLPKARRGVTRRPVT